MKISVGSKPHLVEWDELTPISPELILKIDRCLDLGGISLQGTLVEEISLKLKQTHDENQLIDRCYDEDIKIIAEISILLELETYFKEQGDELLRFDQDTDKRVIARLILPLIIHTLNYQT